MDTIGIRILKPMNEVKANMKTSLTIKMKSGKLKTYSSENWCMWQRNNMTFIQFSLTKFVCGNNLKNVLYKKQINSLKYVIKIINLPPSQLLLYRVDLAYNFIMPYDTKYYLSELNELAKLTVSTYHNNKSRKYYSKFISVLLYDKLKEMFGNRIPIELNHLANRVLRFEVQFTKGLKQLLNYSRHLLLEDLYNPEVLKILLDQWFKYYQMISSDRNILVPLIPSSEKITSAGILEDYFAYIGISKIGSDNINYFLKYDITDNGKRKRMRDKVYEIKSFGNNHFGDITDSAISDLDVKIQRAYNKILAEISSI